MQSREPKKRVRPSAASQPSTKSLISRGLVRHSSTRVQCGCEEAPVESRANKGKYVLYSSESDNDRVNSINLGLDRCASLLANILEENEGKPVQGVPPKDTRKRKKNPFKPQEGAVNKCSRNSPKKGCLKKPVRTARSLADLAKKKVPKKVKVIGPSKTSNQSQELESMDQTSGPQAASSPIKESFQSPLPIGNFSNMFEAGIKANVVSEVAKDKDAQLLSPPHCSRALTSPDCVKLEEALLKITSKLNAPLSTKPLIPSYDLDTSSSSEISLHELDRNNKHENLGFLRRPVFAKPDTEYRQVRKNHAAKFGAKKEDKEEKDIAEHKRLNDLNASCIEEVALRDSELSSLCCSPSKSTIGSSDDSLDGQFKEGGSFPARERAFKTKATPQKGGVLHEAKLKLPCYSASKINPPRTLGNATSSFRGAVHGKSLLKAADDKFLAVNEDCENEAKNVFQEVENRDNYFGSDYGNNNVLLQQTTSSSSTENGGSDLFNSCSHLLGSLESILSQISENLSEMEPLHVKGITDLAKNFVSQLQKRNPSVEDRESKNKVRQLHAVNKDLSRRLKDATLKCQEYDEMKIIYEEALKAALDAKQEKISTENAQHELEKKLHNAVTTSSFMEEEIVALKRKLHCKEDELKRLQTIITDEEENSKNKDMDFEKRFGQCEHSNKLLQKEITILRITLQQSQAESERLQDLNKGLKQTISTLMEDIRKADLRPDPPKEPIVNDSFVTSDSNSTSPLNPSCPKQQFINEPVLYDKSRLAFTTNVPSLGSHGGMRYSENINLCSSSSSTIDEFEFNQRLHALDTDIQNLQQSLRLRRLKS